MPQFQKGRSGNPRGRPRGVVNQAKLRAAIGTDIPDIITTVTEAAKAGDMTAARLLLDRVLPALKPQEQPVALPLGDDLSGAARAVLVALGAAQVSPEQGAKILQGIGTAARVVEVDELVKRIERLEQTHADQTKA